MVPVLPPPGHLGNCLSWSWQSCSVLVTHIVLSATLDGLSQSHLSGHRLLPAEPSVCFGFVSLEWGLRLHLSCSPRPGRAVWRGVLQKCPQDCKRGSRMSNLLYPS